MAKMCFRAHDGKVAIWEKPASGDPMAPFDDPLEHMDLVRFHSDLQFLNSRLTALSVTVNHTSVAGVTGTGYSMSAGSGSTGTSTPISNGQVVTNDYTLFNHGLGYAPIYFVLFGGTVISGGLGVQKATSQLRLVSSYATTSLIRIRDVGISSQSALPAVSLNYDVYVFKDLDIDPAQPLFHVKLQDPGKRITMGHGKVSNSDDTVRRTKPGDTLNLPLPVTRQSDIRNGDIRSFKADGTYAQLAKYNGSLFSYDFVPVTFG